MVEQHRLNIKTQGRGTYHITADIQNAVTQYGFNRGLCHLFIQHTSASLILCENADPMVRDDLERFLVELVPDGSSLFRHIDEGPDDMPAHVRTLLTQSDLTVPIEQGRLSLGIWQGIYLYEHRLNPHHRKILLTLIGDTNTL